jgi:hypothetical protein
VSKCVCVGPTEMELTVTSAKASRYNGNLGVTMLRGPQGAIIYSEVLWSMEDSGMLLVECDCGQARQG